MAQRQGSGWDWCHFDKAEALAEEGELVLAAVVSTEGEDAGAGFEAVVSNFGVEPRVEGGGTAPVTLRGIHHASRHDEAPLSLRRGGAWA